MSSLRTRIAALLIAAIVSVVVLETRMSRRQIKLGLSMRQLGYHAGGWRHPDVPADGAMRIEHFARIARKAEHGLFDMVFLADGLALRQPQGSLCRTDRNVELEPLTLLSAQWRRDRSFAGFRGWHYWHTFHLSAIGTS
ncbi:hypothetical protein [Paracoccus mutanolyticus]|uniref:hypothetical protein n=1 Tax=Paracoccus mutanolyticus TaxID=1499308 RepID=UPI001CB9B625|nr:hypothetical protein [Paracoccus mutanolyticus]